MESIVSAQPKAMRELFQRAAKAIEESSRILAVSHIDTDGITSLAIVISMLQRAEKTLHWQNIHQLNSDTILEVKQLVKEHKPDLVIFSDLGTGQMHLIEEHIAPENVEKIIVLDHHLPSDTRKQLLENSEQNKIIEINPCQHNLSGSYDISAAGVCFLQAYALSKDNVGLSELAIVGASGDLQDYYGKGFTGLNKEIVSLGVSVGCIQVDKDLTFFGINTRPLLFLLEYATDPYLPGITGAREAVHSFYQNLKIPLKTSDDQWRIWVDLSSEEKQRVVQGLIDVILETYENPRVATGIIGEVITLKNRPARTELRSSKEFSTLLNACGRNRRAEVGVRICLGDQEALLEGHTLLKQHRMNLATALRRLESEGYEEKPGMYVVNDPQTQDTIVGIVIGMAQGSRIVPGDKPVIGVSTNTTDEGPRVKVSGRCRRSLVKKGINLKETFTEAGEYLNEQHDSLIVEAGGHPMAAGAFIHQDHLDEFLNRVSDLMAKILG